MKLWKNKKRTLILTLILMEVVSLFLLYKSINNREPILENVNLKEEIKNIKGLAIMIEQDDGSYIESESSSFPKDMLLNRVKSGCIDNLGNKIKDSLNFEDGVANVTTSNTSYCYLYFDINFVANLLESENLWASTLEDDGYRYIGTNPDNYICFGTTDTSTCISDTDKYMYRIIGIFEDNTEGKFHLKLIKKEALNTTYAWHSDTLTDISWDDSDLYKGINGSYFLTNTDYSYMQDSVWNSLIETWNYTATNTKTLENYNINNIYGPYYRFTTVSAGYLHEMNRDSKNMQKCYGNLGADGDCSVGEWKTVSAKIGLIYTSDYQLALGNLSLNYISDTNNDSMKTGWIHLSNNDDNSPNVSEWTMTRYGFLDLEMYGSIHVHGNGRLRAPNVGELYSVRPVFYLTSDVELSGDGTITNPYIIS